MGKVLRMMPSKQQRASSLEVFPSLEVLPLSSPSVLHSPTVRTSLGLRTQTPAPLLALQQLGVSHVLGCSPYSKVVPRSKSLGTALMDQGPGILGNMERPLDCNPETLAQPLP